MAVVPEPAHFLNVDLDIEGRATKIEALVRELDRRLMCLHSDVVRGKRVARYELKSGRTHTVESTLRGLLRVIERLPPDAKQAWGGATKRVFDVGVQSGDEPHDSHYEVSVETIARLAAVGARLVFTMYAPYPLPRKRKR